MVGVVSLTHHILQGTQHRLDELIIGLIWDWGGAHGEGRVPGANDESPLEVVEEDECALRHTEVQEVFSNKKTFVL